MMIVIMIMIVVLMMLLPLRMLDRLLITTVAPADVVMACCW